MAAVIKDHGTTVATVGKVVERATASGVVELSPCVLVGVTMSTGAAFQRAFPTLSALNGWMLAQGADIDVTNVISIAKFTQ